MAPAKDRFVYRKMEIALLILATLFLAVGALVCHLWRGEDARTVVIGAATPAMAFLLTAVLWQALKFKADQFMLPVVAMLSYTSLIFLYRLEPGYAYRQFAWLLIGLFFLFVTTRVFTNYRRLAEYKYVFGLLGAFLLIVPIFFGVEEGGAKSWLGFGLFNVQPSEFVKILVVLFLASYMSENKQFLARGTESFLGMALPGVRSWGPLVGMWGISLILLTAQRDLGTALIYFGTFLAMVYVATSRLAYICTGIVLFLSGGAFSYLIFDHVQQRIDIWLLNPSQFVELGEREYSQAYQIIQSLFAIGAGGLTGAGLGAGQPRFIPAVHTDFIFSAITEETGLMGGAGILLLYTVFIYRGLKVALESRDDFSKLLALGLTALMGLQAFIIVAGVTKLLPLTGVTLPFISYGGSSLVANFIILGMLLNISHEARSHE